MSELLELESSQPEASASVPPQPLCSVCSNKYAIYTCPRCHTRSCSLPCSTTHKTDTGCTGERNKVAYIPMNQYSWGTMMDDYTYLEDMGRKVGEWGKIIVNGGFAMGNGRGKGRGEARGRGRGRGRGGRGGGSGNVKTKRDILKMQLEIRDIDMDLLPMGMERRKLNQSSWDFKNQTALLTIEFKFYPPSNPLAPSSQPPEPLFILLTHRNDIKLPLLTLIQKHIKERSSNAKKEGAIPAWVKSLVIPDPDVPDTFDPPHCVMPAPLDPLATLSQRSKTRAFYKLDPDETLAVLLSSTYFVEFPTIEVWEEFEGTVVDTNGTVTQRGQEDNRWPKRRRMNEKAGKAAISGLLGEYGSDEEVDEGEEAQNGLALIGDYAGSEDEDEVDETNVPGVGESEAEDAEMSDNETEIDPAVLLKLLRQARGGDVVEEDDTADWGEEDEADTSHLVS